jgi:AraC-like DNA-binding protein
VKRSSAQNLRTEFLTAAVFRPFIRELLARDIDYRGILAPLGIRDLGEGEPKQFLSPQQVSAFLSRTVELTNDPAIGLHAGVRMHLGELGLFGLLLRSSADGQTVCGHYSAYRGAIEDMANAQVSIVDGVVIYRRGDRGIEPSRVLSEYFATSAIACIRELQGDVAPVEVRLMHPLPKDTREHVHLLGPRLRFGEHEDAVVFSADLLSRPVLHHDPLAAEVLQRHISQLPNVVEERASDLLSRTRRLIATGLSRNQATMPEVAELLQMSERTLRRRLWLLGTSFQTLLDEVRRDRALHYLCHSRYSTLEVSSRLGFNGTGAFYRAFRRWTGSSWSKYKSEHAWSSAELCSTNH